MASPIAGYRWRRCIRADLSVAGSPARVPSTERTASPRLLLAPGIEGVSPHVLAAIGNQLLPGDETGGRAEQEHDGDGDGRPRACPGDGILPRAALHRVVQAEAGRGLAGGDEAGDDGAGPRGSASPSPVTIAVPPGRRARTAVAVAAREIGPGPYILKPRKLATGFAVLRAAAVSELTAAIDIAAQSGIGYIIQPCIDHASDTRAYFADGEVIAAQERTAAPGGYLADLGQGGAAAACRDTSAIAGPTRAIAESLRASLLSVDWMITPAAARCSAWSTGIGLRRATRTRHDRRRRCPFQVGTPALQPGHVTRRGMRGGDQGNAQCKSGTRAA